MDLLEHLTEDSARFRRAIASADPKAPVPSCPDWTADDLLWHLTEVQAFWANLVEQRATEKIRPDVERATSWDAGLDLFDHWSARLIVALAGIADDVPIYTWHTLQNAFFIRRRQTHEALIHRVDAELTAGQTPLLDPDLASDGIEEVLDWQVGTIPGWGTFTPDGRITRISTTDTDRTWRVAHGTFDGTHESGTAYADHPCFVLADGGEPDAAISGTAAALDLWLWGRGPDDGIDGPDDRKAELRRIVAGDTD